MDQQALIDGAIGNSTTHNLDLKYIYSCSGRFKSAPAPVVEAGKVTTFEHEGQPPNGSIAIVACHAHGHRWVLAWIVPTFDGETVNKVYVEDGPYYRDRDAEIDREEIGKKLESAGSFSVSPGAAAVLLPSDGKARLAAQFFDPKPN